MYALMATPRTPPKACFRVSRRASRTTASSSVRPKAEYEERPRFLVTVKTTTKAKPGTVMSTMPRTPPKASISEVSTPVPPPAPSGSAPPSGPAPVLPPPPCLPPPLTRAYSDPTGRSSYRGLKSTRRPR